MRLARLVVLAVAAVCSLTAAASADGYYAGEAYGGTHVGDELGSHVKDGALRVQLTVGARRGAWALEAFSAFDLNLGFDDRQGNYGWAGTPDPRTSVAAVGMNLKYIAPLSRHFDLYVKGSASEGFLSGGGFDNWSGRGLGMGAGVSLHGKVSVLGLLAWPLLFINKGPKMNASLYLDDGYDFYRFHENGDLHGPSIDGTLSHISMGFTFGSDF